MFVRRNDARRRRLVVDPSQTTNVGLAEGTETAPSMASQEGAFSSDVRAYSFGAERRNHHKTSDLIPKRIVSYLLVVLFMLICLGMLNLGSIKSPQWESQIGREGVSSLAIHGRGSLASWFSSFLLIMTGLASLQIYALRQHRCDDYRGTYRLWIWIAALMVVASVNCVVNLGGLLTQLFESLTSSSLTQRPWLLITIKVSALTLLVARGLFEVRESRGSLAWVVLVWLGYSAAALMQLPTIDESLTDLNPDMIVGNCTLVATIALVMAHLNYARFVFFQAHGLIKPRVRRQQLVQPKSVAKPKKKAKAKPKAASKAPDEAKSTEPQPVAGPSKKPKKTKPQRPKVTQAKVSQTKRDEKTAKPLTDSGPEIRGGTSGNGRSAQDVLKELAAASRAKQQVTPELEEYDEEHETEGVIKMSKAQRRRQRKANRSRKRAA